MGITLTELAAKEVKNIIKQQADTVGKEGTEPKKMYLRIGVKGGGCSGFNYSLDLTDSITDSDESSEQHGIDVICDSKSLLYLEGTTVDFRDEVMGRGFVFNNPNATSTCGCGSSFST